MEQSQNRYRLQPAANWQSNVQYSFDGRSFNINCGFSADGNVFLLPALRCDEVVGPLFVTRSDALWMSCPFESFTFEWYCFKCLFNTLTNL